MDFRLRVSIIKPPAMMRTMAIIGWLWKNLLKIEPIEKMAKNKRDMTVRMLIGMSNHLFLPPNQYSSNKPTATASINPGHIRCQISNSMEIWQMMPVVKTIPPGTSTPTPRRCRMKKYNQWKNTPTGMTNKVGQKYSKMVPVLNVLSPFRNIKIPKIINIGPRKALRFIFNKLTPKRYYPFSITLRIS